MTQQNTQEKPNYLESVTRAATQADDSGVQSPEDFVRPVAGNTAPTHTPRPEGARSNTIRSIVSEALLDTNTKKVDANAEEIAPSAAKPNRQRLQEAVTNAPLPMESLDGSYLSTLKEEVSKTVVIEKAGSAPSTTIGADNLAAPATMEADLYTVRYGDSLWNIAARTYGDSHQWESIYNANRNIITHANILVVGQILKIPKRDH